ncbi:uncharacterized protein LOC107366391 [Tetranychus urticae]|uniref:Uncharacterized protein n=1 Tax=Tetranychus urticae TaxID=32264 RepID=T1KQN4_TETUR|nr:uncharacterized protein LOC107366391 [Tetranychus urticae]XP_015789474.1 uncharacterized protein LOC107366391 [Tetranychus urticae]
MLMCAKSARDMLIKMSYKGFEIRDEKDFLKCLLSIFSDYLGSIFHDKDNQQETIFHHLAQSIPYTLEGKSKLKKVHERKEDHNSDCDETGEKRQSSVSNGKLLEPEKESDDTSFGELTISFDLTSLSYNCSIIGNSSHVIFLETRSVYSLNDDILCKYIYYRTDQSTDNGADESVTSDKDGKHDRIEIHAFTDGNEGSHQGSLVSSLPVLNNQSMSCNESILKTLLISKSNFNVETGQNYCFLYIDSNRSVLGKSGPFQFSSQPSSQIPELYNAADSDDDGFVIVDS